MDGAADNIEDRRQALVRILAGLVAMAGLNGRATLPRALRNAVFRLLRPAESAARRLVVALACGHSVSFAFRPRKPKTSLRPRRQYMPVMPPQPGQGKQPRYPKTLPLLDPPRKKPGPRWVAARSVPHIGLGPRPRIPEPPSPRDLMDATRLTCRFDALSAVLADPQKQALRFARFQARQAFWRARDRTSRAALRRPLRFGPPPGSLRRSEHPVHDVLDFSHALALEALRKQKPDTS